MDKPKSKVIKSKSSDITVFTKAERHKNKKTSSNAEFISKVVKKRGVYVENKVTKTNFDTKDKTPVQNPIIKPLTRKRPGKKKFLASVLTILSKSTTGTQYDIKTEKPIKAKHKTIKGYNEYDQMIIEESILNDNNSINKGKKYKSNILNGRRNVCEKVVVLRSKTDIVHSPSIYSDKSNSEIQWSDFPRLIKADNNNEDIQKKNEETAIYHCVADGIGNVTNKKVTIDPEPTTLVSKKPKDELYNFFVDLLETTFDVYNVKTESNRPTTVSSSSIALHIDESVAKKLEVKNDFDEVTQKPRKYNSINNIERRDDFSLLENFQSKPLSIKFSQEVLPLKYGRKRHRATVDNKKITNTQSFFLPTKKSTRKHTKNNLLTLFKEQLKMDVESYVEPDNLYQALKIMAKNKRKCQKATKFDRITKYSDTTECKFKRRKVISPNKYRKRYKPESELLRSITRKFSETTVNVRNVNSLTNYHSDLEESKHSLEVYGYDFDHEVSRIEKRTEDKEVMFAYHSSPSTSDYDTNEAILKYNDSTETVKNVFKSLNHTV